MIVALAGGIGASKLLEGLYELLGPDLTIIGNTGDDLRLFGLRLCPDLDTIVYTLCGRVERTRGWGLAGDGFSFLDEARRLGMPSWFSLGDRDLATHLFRSWRLGQGWTLDRVTAEIARKRGLTCRLLPMSRQYLPTYVETVDGRLHLQEYFAREKCRPTVKGFRYGERDGAGNPCPGVLRALRSAQRILLCPSNPFISIAPILALRGVRRALRAKRERVVAISPVAAGRAFKGPTAEMLRSLGYPAGIDGVAHYYGDMIGTYVIDRRDAERMDSLRRRFTVKCLAADIEMRTRDDKLALAQTALEAG